MAATSGYGSYNPREDQPSAVETALATIIGQNNPSNAQNLLNTYQTARQTSQGNYDYELGQQHDFAKQQLAQQLYEANLKGLAEAKDPTVLQLMAGNPTYSGVLGDNRANIGDALARAQAGQSATTLEHAGAGAYSAAQAGRDITDAQAAQASGGLLGPAGTPLSTRNEMLKEAHADARAALHAGTEKAMTVPYKFGETAAGEPITGQIKIPPNATDAQIQAIGENARRVYSGIYPQGTGVPGATAPGDAAPAPPQQTRRPIQAPASPPPSTSLQPMAQRDPGTSGTLATPSANTAQPASKQFITDTKAQGLAARGLQYLPADAKLDVGANVQGKIIPIVPLTGGGAGYVGKSGKVYTLPKPGQQQ